MFGYNIDNLNNNKKLLITNNLIENVLNISIRVNDKIYNLNFDKIIKFDSKNNYIFFNIPKNIIKIRNFILNINYNNVVNNYNLEFDIENDIMLLDKCLKDNYDYYDFKKNSKIKLREKIILCNNNKISLRWDKKGLRYILFHINNNI